MLIAGEASGDLLAAELIPALREEIYEASAVPTPEAQPLRTSLAPRFFGAGGPRMAAAGAELAFDMTAHAVTGLSDVLKNILQFRRLLRQLYRLAVERQPDAIVCVDFSGFNRRLAHGIRQYVRRRADWFHPWAPRIVQYVSPQVWASREGRAYQMALDYDLLLSIFPFEKEWYGRRVPEFHVEFVGHPMLDRYADLVRPGPSASGLHGSSTPMVLLLPGSRAGELKRHLPVMLGALAGLRAAIPGLRVRMVLPDEALVRQARACGLPAELEVRCGGLPEVFREADLAIASTGTVTMECAFFGVPTVALYKTSWSTYQVAKRMITVKYLAMPNLLGNEEVFPEFIQQAATAERITRAALELLRDEPRRLRIKGKLAEVVALLGGPGATRRAAQAIARLL